MHVIHLIPIADPYWSFRDWRTGWPYQQRAGWPIKDGRTGAGTGWPYRDRDDRTSFRQGRGEPGLWQYRHEVTGELVWKCRDDAYYSSFMKKCLWNNYY